MARAWSKIKHSLVQCDGEEAHSPLAASRCPSSDFLAPAHHTVPKLCGGCLSGLTSLGAKVLYASASDVSAGPGPA